MIKCEVILASDDVNDVDVTDGLARKMFEFPIVPRKGDVIVIPLYSALGYEVTEVQITATSHRHYNPNRAISLRVKEV